MSAFVVDPRTIDYLIQYAQQHRGYGQSGVGITVPRSLAKADLPAWLDYQPGDRFYAQSVSANELGQVLLTENVRSVRARYEDCPSDDLPGPIDRRRIWSYRFQPILAPLKPAWVVKACDCLDYQSCETSDWQETLAYAIVQAIRESAIGDLTDKAPWGISDDDLQVKQTA